MNPNDYQGGVPEPPQPYNVPSGPPVPPGNAPGAPGGSQVPEPPRPNTSTDPMEGSMEAPMDTPPPMPPNEPQTFDQYQQQQGMDSPYTPPAYNTAPQQYGQEPVAYDGMGQPIYQSPGHRPTFMDPNSSVQQPPMVPPTSYYDPAETPKRSRLPFIIGGVVVLLLILLTIAGIMWFRNQNSDLKQSQQVSQEFMTAVNAKDGAKAYSLLSEAAQKGTQESDYAPFIEASGAKLQGSFSETKNEVQPGTEETRAFFLYEFPEADHKYARTIIQKKDGKWGVISFVHSSQALELVPASSSATVNNGAAAEQ